MFVKSTSGKTYTLMVNPWDKIRDLKIKIQLKIGIYPSLQRLLYEGKQLDNRKTLADYNIQKDSTLQLAFHLLGGIGEELTSG